MGWNTDLECEKERYARDHIVYKTRFELLPDL